MIVQAIRTPELNPIPSVTASRENPTTVYAETTFGRHALLNPRLSAREILSNLAEADWATEAYNLGQGPFDIGSDD